MALLKDSVVTGDLRVTNNLYSTTAQFQILKAPSTSGGTDYGLGTAGYVLKTGANGMYWSALSSSDIPTLSITDKTSGTLPVTRGGTGATSIPNIQAGKDGDGNTISSTYLKLSGGKLSGNLELNAVSGNSPALIFTRDGDLTDWRILVTAGKLSFQSTTDASSWAERASFADNNGNFTVTGSMTATSFSGSGASLTSLSASNISSGTLSADRLATSGATAGSYGDSAAQTPGYGATFKVPYITVDNKGRVTSISEHTVKIPASDNTNTDTLVKQTSKSDDVNYKILTTTSASPTSGNAAEVAYSANIYANPSTGTLNAVRHSFNVSGTEKAYLNFNSTDSSLDLIFM